MSENWFQYIINNKRVLSSENPFYLNTFGKIKETILDQFGKIGWDASVGEFVVARHKRSRGFRYQDQETLSRQRERDAYVDEPCLDLAITTPEKENSNNIANLYGAIEVALKKFTPDYNNIESNNEKVRAILRDMLEVTGFHDITWSDDHFKVKIPEINQSWKVYVSFSENEWDNLFQDLSFEKDNKDNVVNIYSNNRGLQLSDAIERVNFNSFDGNFIDFVDSAFEWKKKLAEVYEAIVIVNIMDNVKKKLTIISEQA